MLGEYPRISPSHLPSTAPTANVHSHARQPDGPPPPLLRPPAQPPPPSAGSPPPATPSQPTAPNLDHGMTLPLRPSLHEGKSCWRGEVGAEGVREEAEGGEAKAKCGSVAWKTLAGLAVEMGGLHCLVAKFARLGLFDEKGHNVLCSLTFTVFLLVTSVSGVPFSTSTLVHLINASVMGLLWIQSGFLGHDSSLYNVMTSLGFNWHQ